MPEAESAWTDIPPIYFAEQVAQHATSILGNFFGHNNPRITQVCTIYLEEDLASMRGLV